MYKMVCYLSKWIYNKKLPTPSRVLNNDARLIKPLEQIKLVALENIILKKERMSRFYDKSQEKWIPIRRFSMENNFISW